MVSHHITDKSLFWVIPAVSIAAILGTREQNVILLKNK
jgi:hypothetical protein